MIDTSLTFVVDRIEGKFAVLKGEDGLEINWPKKNLPKDTKEGSVVVLKAVPEAEETAHRRQTAKELLNEILNG